MPTKKVIETKYDFAQEELNPNVKSGDEIIFLESRNSGNAANLLELRKCKVIGSHTTRAKRGNFAVTTDGMTGAFTVYQNSAPNDVYIMYSRVNMAKVLGFRIENQKAELKQLEAEMKLLKKFKTDEEEVAFKLVSIMTAAEGGTVKEKTAAISGVLKEMKKSDYI